MLSKRELGYKFGKSVAQSTDVAALTFVVLAQSEMVDDVTITENFTLFSVWDSNWTGKAGTILQDEGQLFRSIHDVGEGQNTKPYTTPSMWTKIGNPADEFPEWSQPIGAHDAYSIGSKVSHKGKNWISTANGNVWEPGVYGWDEA